MRVLVPTRAAPADRWVGLKKQSAALDGLAPGDALSFERAGPTAIGLAPFQCVAGMATFREAEFEMLPLDCRTDARAGGQAPATRITRKHPSYWLGFVVPFLICSVT